MHLFIVKYGPVGNSRCMCLLSVVTVELWATEWTRLQVQGQTLPGQWWGGRRRGHTQQQIWHSGQWRRGRYAHLGTNQPASDIWNTGCLTCFVGTKDSGPFTPCILCSGQEGATIDCDEGVPITPFNLEEEMQEGHFDSEGNYFIKKDQEIRDNWLDNIDWVRHRMAGV